MYGVIMLIHFVNLIWRLEITFQITRQSYAPDVAVYTAVVVAVVCEVPLTLLFHYRVQVTSFSGQKIRWRRRRLLLTNK